MRLSGRRGLPRCEFAAATELLGAEAENHLGKLGVQVYLQHRIAKFPDQVEDICRLPTEKPWDAGVWQLEHLRYVKLNFEWLEPVIQLPFISPR